jgi:hypothetical protein
MGTEHFGLWNTRGRSNDDRTFCAFGTHEDDHMETEHFGRLEHTRTIICKRTFWATGIHEDDHLGKEHFGRLEHRRTIIWEKNILGVWNTRERSNGDTTFWAFETHED